MNDDQWFAVFVIFLEAVAVAVVIGGVWALTTYAIVEKTETLEVASVIVGTGGGPSILKDTHGNTYYVQDPFLAKEISEFIGPYKVKMKPLGLYPVVVTMWQISEAERLVG